MYAPANGAAPRAVALLLLAVLGGCSSEPAPADGGADPSAACDSNEACSDGLFCNGVERCAPAEPGADERGCVAATSRPCAAGQECDEGEDACFAVDCDAAPDADGDGHDGVGCGGDDCDDRDADRYPGNAEVCDEDGHDEDCDPTTFGRRDADSDGYVDIRCCDLSSGEAICGQDCDDGAPDRFPGLVEACDGKDNDCDRSVDEGLELTFYRDADGDGFGLADDSRGGVCTPPAGYVSLGGDCDDSLPGRNPGAPEVCDSVDNDCDGELDEGVLATFYRDADGDNFGDSAAALDACTAPPGHVANASDCDDASAARNPGNSELCDAVHDNDCNAATSPFDADGDGFDAAACGGTDCDDGDATVFPGAAELCDRMDNRCASGGGARPTEDADSDGYYPADAGCSGGPLMPGDCDDTRAEAFPLGAEVCDGADNDCDGEVDEDPEAEASCNRTGTVGTCISGTCSIAACSAPHANCDGEPSNGCEANLQTDEASCGACLNACPIGATCEGGGCQCPAGAQTLCGGACVDIVTHEANCGGCGNVCPSGATCESGACRCGGGFDACGGLCVDLLSDTAHCGACGAGCFGGSCEGGSCVCSGADPAVCEGSCRDLASDNLNCGACGATCIGGSCAGGTCSCADDQSLCDGACIDTSSDPRNCGGCGLECIAGAECVAGGCSPSLDWVRPFGSTDRERVGGVAVNGDGDGVYVVSYGGAVDLGGGLITPDDSEVAAFAYAPDGTYRWRALLDVGFDARAVGAAALPSGDVVAAYNLSGGAPTLVRLRPDGSEAWRSSLSATTGTTRNEFLWPGQTLSATPSGDVVVTFPFRDSASPGGLGPFEAVANQDILMVGVSGADGSVLWAWQLGAQLGSPYPTSVEVDSAGRLYLSGAFDDAVDFGSGTVFPQGETDGFLLALAADRAFRWVRFASGPQVVAIEDVVLISDDPVVIASYSQREVTLGGQLVESMTDPNSAAARFDAAGSLSWAAPLDLGGTANLTGAALHAGDLVVAGRMQMGIGFEGYAHLWVDPSTGMILTSVGLFPSVEAFRAAVASSASGLYGTFLLNFGSVPRIPGEGSHSHRGFNDGVLYFLGD